ncbi:hypothetical protein IFR04_000260 [Cadophora malorum]|uniref:Uncharacterized protein n=1 Tax=Cadophora malorum TaxID=108018 RepID=A0A8H7WL78_9HELO|nr:hypothetical protein IFR04_000260 [Cadophora malorum]
MPSRSFTSTSLYHYGCFRKDSDALCGAHKLSQLPGFEVALFIRRRGRVTAYRSIDDDSWWPVKADIDFAYPPPTNLLPHHFEKDRTERVNETATE